MTNEKKHSSFLKVLFMAGIMIVLMITINYVVGDGFGTALIFWGTLLVWVVLIVVGYVQFIQKNPSIWQMRRKERQEQQRMENQKSEPSLGALPHDPAGRSDAQG